MQRLAHILQILLIMLAVFAAFRLAGQYPFYYSWDMDLTVIQDMLLLGDNQFPTHYAHPGLGMNLILYSVYFVAQTFGLITSVNIANLKDSLEPLLIIAEQTDFLRQVNALFCILLAVTLWKAFEALYSPGASRISLKSSLILILFLLVPGLWNYNIVLIRTETYSLLFWSGAAMFAILAAVEIEPKKINRYIQWAGFFCAMSLFTKIQSFFLIALIPFIFFFLKQPGQKTIKVPEFSIKRFVYVFVGLGFYSILILVPSYISTFSSNWLPNKFFFVLVAILYFIHAVQTKKPILKRFNFDHTSWADFFILLLQGARFVLIVPLLLPVHFMTSFFNSILTFKVVFLRWDKFSELGQIGRAHV